MNRARRLVGVLVAGVAATGTLVACSGGEGTVVAKAEQGTYDYGCGAGGTVTSPVAAPVWGACSDAKCWRLVVRDSDGDTFEPCVSREEYDRTQPGTFWHERTDR
jgi:hypothetical protein